MNSTPAPASFGRRLGALLYDGIAAITVLYFAAFIPVLAHGAALVSGNPLFTLYLLVVLFIYFWLGWRRGRTLGMQAWKLEIVTTDGERPDLRRAIVRFAAAALALVAVGIGYLMALFDAENRAFHDRVSGTRLQRQPLR